MNKLTFLCAVLILASCTQEKKREPIVVNYPVTKKVDTVDTYFGTEVKDPYRWLEDDRSTETKAWVKTQNAATFGYLDKIPFREDLKNRLEKLWLHTQHKLSTHLHSLSIIPGIL